MKEMRNMIRVSIENHLDPRPSIPHLEECAEQNNKKDVNREELLTAEVFALLWWTEKNNKGVNAEGEQDAITNATEDEADNPNDLFLFQCRLSLYKAWRHASGGKKRERLSERKGCKLYNIKFNAVYLILGQPNSSSKLTLENGSPADGLQDYQCLIQKIWSVHIFWLQVQHATGIVLLFIFLISYYSGQASVALL